MFYLIWLNSMKKHIVIILILGAAVVALFAWRLKVRHDNDVVDQQFISRVTNFEFPASTEYLARYDNSESFIVAVFRLPKEEAAAFAKKYTFGNLTNPIDWRDWEIGMLPKKYTEIPQDAGTLITGGQTKYQSWKAAVNLESGLLWIYIQYPDWSGDHPGWGPQPYGASSSK